MTRSGFLARTLAAIAAPRALLRAAPPAAAAVPKFAPGGIVTMREPFIFHTDYVVTAKDLNSFVRAELDRAARCRPIRLSAF